MVGHTEILNKMEGRSQVKKAVCHFAPAVIIEGTVKIGGKNLVCRRKTHYSFPAARFIIMVETAKTTVSPVVTIIEYL
jgi:hypothetical protein